MNQNLNLDTGEPCGKIHGFTKPYQMIDPKVMDWDVWDLCEDCIKSHEKKGWKCTKIEK